MSRGVGEVLAMLNMQMLARIVLGIVVVSLHHKILNLMTTSFFWCYPLIKMIVGRAGGFLFGGEGCKVRVMKKMMRVVFVVALGLFLAVPEARAADPAREMSLQMSRYEQMIGKLQDSIERLQSDMRALQRENSILAKDAAGAKASAARVSDQMQTISNVEFARLQAQQKDLATKLVTQKEVYDWGSGQRGCQVLGVTHQQIKTTVSPDGLKAVKYLCFDGRVIHLGTALNTVE